MKTISCQSKQRPRRPRSGRKGVSTIIGITIFLLIFAIAISYTFAWNSQVGNYLKAVKAQVNLDQQQAGEKLIVKPFNSTFVEISNPTVNTIVVSQIWSEGLEVWHGQQGVPPYGNYNASGFINPTGSSNFEVVTLQGSIFSGKGPSLATSVWQVNWYYNNTETFSNNNSTLELSNNTPVGNTSWDNVNLEWSWTIYNNPVIGSISMNSTDMMGFVATTTLIKLTDNNSIATINYFTDGNSSVAVGVDGIVPNWNTPMPMPISGDLHSTHVVTVYFYFNGTSDTSLQLNVVNATFAP